MDMKKTKCQCDSCKAIFYVGGDSGNDLHVETLEVKKHTLQLTFFICTNCLKTYKVSLKNMTLLAMDSGKIARKKYTQKFDALQKQFPGQFELKQIEDSKRFEIIYKE